MSDQTALLVSRFLLLTLSLCFNYAALAADKSVLRIGVVHEHNVYMQASASYALSWEIVEQSSARINLGLRPMVNSWEGNMRQLEAGKIDGVFIAIRTPEREAWAMFSLPLVNTGSALFTHRSSDVSAMEQVDFTSETVGVSAASAQYQLARQVGFASIYQSSKTSHLYQMLAHGRVDYLFKNVDLAESMCKPSTPVYCLKMVGDVHYRNTAHIISSRKHRSSTDALSALDSAIEDFSRSEDVTSLFERFSKAKQRLSHWQSLISAAYQHADSKQGSASQLIAAP